MFKNNHNNLVKLNYDKNKYKQHYYKLRYDYYSNFINIKTFEDLLNFYKKRNKTYLKIQLNVKFKNIEFNSTLTDVIKTLGNPKFEIDNDNIKNHKILFYKYKIGNLKTRSMLHFIGDLFFIGQYLFKTQRPDEIELIETNLKNKYLNVENIDLTKIILYDNEKNQIEFEKNIYLSINYISGNNMIINYLKNEILKKERKNKAIENENLKKLYDLL